MKNRSSHLHPDQTILHPHQDQWDHPVQWVVAVAAEEDDK